MPWGHRGARAVHALASAPDRHVGAGSPNCLQLDDRDRCVHPATDLVAHADDGLLGRVILCPEQQVVLGVVEPRVILGRLARVDELEIHGVPLLRWRTGRRPRLDIDGPAYAYEVDVRDARLKGRGCVAGRLKTS